MKLIAHRGNINGPNQEMENNPDYILNTLRFGYDCEIDVHLINNELYLGHDAPTYKITVDFLLKNQPHNQETKRKKRKMLQDTREIEKITFGIRKIKIY